LESRSKNEGFPILCLSLTRILALVKMGLGVVVVMVDLHLKQVLKWPMTKMWVKMLRKVYELKQRDGSSINSSNSNKIKKFAYSKQNDNYVGFSQTQWSKVPLWIALSFNEWDVFCVITSNKLKGFDKISPNIKKKLIMYIQYHGITTMSCHVVLEHL
jgi:hypothetical protein